MPDDPIWLVEVNYENRQQDLLGPVTRWQAEEFVINVLSTGTYKGRRVKSARIIRL